MEEQKIIIGKLRAEERKLIAKISLLKAEQEKVVESIRKEEKVYESYVEQKHSSEYEATGKDYDKLFTECSIKHKKYYERDIVDYLTQRLTYKHLEEIHLIVLPGVHYSKPGDTVGCGDGGSCFVSTDDAKRYLGFHLSKYVHDKYYCSRCERSHCVCEKRVQCTHCHKYGHHYTKCWHLAKMFQAQT